MRYSLEKVASADEWRSYHEIRRSVLFEARGRIGVYRSDHPDEFKAENHPLLLKLDGLALGVTRFDVRGGGEGVVRLVAIKQQAQRRGHGRVLSSLTDEFARSLDVHSLFVNAAPEALGYYEKMGWTPFAWDPGELQGIALDNIQMRKLLHAT
jgi:N-acetylglutamate synthase-like GNAT family acetyltransferase